MLRGRVSHLLGSNHLDPQSLKKRLVVMAYCDSSFLPVLKHASGIILQNSLLDSESEAAAAAIVKAHGISLIYRADNAMTMLREDEEVFLDPLRGLVFRGTDEISACQMTGLDQ